MYLSKHKHIVCGLAPGGLILVALFLLLSDTSQTARSAPGELFVTPGGAGDCSQGNPCDHQTALSQAVGGNTLFLAQGTYTGTGGAVITLTKHARSGARYHLALRRWAWTCSEEGPVYWHDPA